MTAIQKKVAKDYKQYRAPKNLPTFDEFCYPKSFNVQRQQAFSGDYMAPGKGHNSLLVFHKIGAGKTCLSIQIAERWTKHGKPLIIMPASLIPGFRNELRSKCAGDKYLTQSERNHLATLKPGDSQWKKIIAISDERIDETYQIYSYNRFADAMVAGKHIHASIIIIDEVQNINNLSGVFFTSCLNWINANPTVPAVIMSGTPIFDRASEILGLALLLRIPLDHIEPHSLIYKPLLPSDITKKFDGKVSYFAGAPAYTFPKMIIKVKKLQMSKFQQRWYQSQVEAESTKFGVKLKEITNDFYIKSRQRSNITYPNGLTGDEGLDALTPAIIRQSLDVYSCKFAAIIKRLAKKQLSFVYTGFTGAGGIEALKKCLAVMGWQDYAVAGVGPKRYAVWSGDQSLGQKDKIRAIYNSPANNDGSQIQVVIGSPSIKEGVSLMRTREVHILEAYWNHSRLEQIYGRAVRYCSHKTLPKHDRDVTIYIYAAIAENAKITTPASSIDLYMLDMADKKRVLSEPIIDALIKIAVDRGINYPR